MTVTDVGKVWDVAINDVGYRLRWDAEPGYRRTLAPLDADRFADGATPFTEAIQRYSFLNHSEWYGGAGQKFLNRNDSDSSSFWRSVGVDPFCPCGSLHLRLAPERAVQIDTTLGLLACGSKWLMAQTDDLELSTYSISGDAITAEDTYTLSTTVPLDMSLGDTYGYVAQGATGLSRITLGSTTLSTGWSSLDVFRVLWIGDRLAVVYRDSGTSTWRFSTITTAGAEEVAGGLFTLTGATSASIDSADRGIGGMTYGGGFVWFTSWANYGDEGIVHVWPVDTTASASTALQLPSGEKPIDVFYYQGQVFIRAYRANAGVAVIYRCEVGGDGTLRPFLVIDGENATPGVRQQTGQSYRGKQFAAKGDSVYFSWEYVDGFRIHGLGIINLATGGYCLGPYTSPAGNYSITSVGVWGDRPAWSQANDGVWRETSDTYYQLGYLDTSLADADSAVGKRWDQGLLRSEPIPASTSVTVNYTIDGGASYVALPALTLTTAQDSSIGDLAIESASLGLRLWLSGPGDSTPMLKLASVMFHAKGLHDEILTLPIDCSETSRALHGRPDARTRTGMGIARALEGLIGEQVIVQDVDWPETRAERTYELVAVDVTGLAIYNRSVGLNDADGLVASCTFRRPSDSTFQGSVIEVATSGGGLYEWVDPGDSSNPPAPVVQNRVGLWFDSSTAETDDEVSASRVWLPSLNDGAGGFVTLPDRGVNNLANSEGAIAKQISDAVVAFSQLAIDTGGNDPETAGFDPADYPDFWVQRVENGATGDELWIKLTDETATAVWRQLA